MGEDERTRPWSTEEFIANSDNWNLAGDVALLNTLKAFADNLLRRSGQINDNLQNLTNKLDETALQLDIAQNEFQSLRNRQFIESRVYEDDETLPQNDSVKKDEENLAVDATEAVREAALRGLAIIDSFFDKIPVSVSDSDDEEDDIDIPNYVMRAKDRYLDRPLPYVIGTEEWHRKWHVGLEDSSSEDSDKNSEQFSESDSEILIQDRSQIKGTSDTTSSELEFVKNPPIVIDSKPDLQSSDSGNSLATPANVNFHEELAAKLAQEPEVNRRPLIQTKAPYATDLFFDEPPPLEENISKGLFSGGTGLFDDDDDGNYNFENNEATPVKKETGLFDEVDDDLFVKKTILAPLPSIKPPLFDEEPPELTTPDRKKPIGGVSIFGGGNLFNQKLLRQPSTDDDDDVTQGNVASSSTKAPVDLFSEADDLFKVSPKIETESKKIDLFRDDKSEVIIKSGEKSENVKKLSLFDDDDDDLFKEDLFTPKSTNKFASDLFSDDVGAASDHLFTQPTIFHDSLPNSNNKNSINVDCETETRKVTPEVKINKPTSISDDDLFKDDVFEEENKSVNLFGDYLKSSEHKDIFTGQVGRGLFDSPPPDDDDDLFASQLDNDDDLFQNKTQPTVFRDIFDPVPPPDDLWETKPPQEVVVQAKSNLFDEESPVASVKPEKKESSLFEEESPISSVKHEKKDSNVLNITEKFEKEDVTVPVSKPPPASPGKLKLNLNINVGALMPGVTPPLKKSSDAVQSPTESHPEVVAGFDDVEVLQSVTKDRVKVPFHRRPSTRRGRKAALKKSNSDFTLQQEEAEKSNVEELKVEPAKAEDVAVVVKKSASLFDDSDDEDDLFSAKKLPVPVDKNLKKASLFDDEDDDDLFKSFSTATVVKKTEPKMAVGKKISQAKKLTNIEPEDDPLSAFLK